MTGAWNVRSRSSRTREGNGEEQERMKRIFSAFVSAADGGFFSRIWWIVGTAVYQLHPCCLN